MEKQTIVNAILALNGTLNVLVQSGDKEAIDSIVSKIMELAKRL